MTNIEHRDRVLSEIARRAPVYTPEWRFSPERPDAGTALSMIWADMYAGTLERFERLPDNYRRTLFDAIGSEPRPAVAASGFLAFSIRADTGDCVIPKGTVAASPSDPDAALVTCHDLAAGSAKVSAIYCVIPPRDVVQKLDSLTNTELLKTTGGTAHVWTFTHGFALDASRAAALRLTPEIEDCGLDVLELSPWEYRDGECWREMSVVRDGDSLLCVFPEDKENCGAVRVSVTRNALLRGLTAKPSGNGLFPDAIYTDSTQEQNDFYPFGQRFIPGVCAYFACRDALTKPGARVELSLTLSYGDFEIEGYSETQIYMKKVMRASDFKPPEEFTITAAEIRWEYFNGVGWAALGVDDATNVFNGGTSGRIRIEFNCPDDLCPAVVGAHELPFIRVRLVAAENLYRQRGKYRTPHISDIRFGYRYQRGVPITDISVVEHLDKGTANLPVRLAAQPDGPAALYFAFDTGFSRGSILFHIRSGVLNAGTSWEYLSDTGWEPLDVRDGTGGLRKTGLLTYQTALPAKKARLWGREAYWVRLNLDDCVEDNNSRGPYLYGAIRLTTQSANLYLYGLYENAVRAEARIPGRSSVLPAGAFTTLLTPLAGVESVINPIAAYGGADAEEECRIIERLSAALSHSGRAVSREDCAELAMEASLCVLRTRCYPHTDEHGEYAYGKSCLVVLARDTEESGFTALRDEIMSYIMPRRALGAEKLIIIPPQFIAVNVLAKVLIEGSGETLTVKNKVGEMLAELLSPANWEIGQIPAPGQISAAIRAVSGVLRLVKSNISYTVPSGISVDYVRVARKPFVLPVSGKYEFVFIDKELT